MSHLTTPAKALKNLLNRIQGLIDRNFVLYDVAKLQTRLLKENKFVVTSAESETSVINWDYFFESVIQDVEGCVKFGEFQAVWHAKTRALVVEEIERERDYFESLQRKIGTKDRLKQYQKKLVNEPRIGKNWHKEAYPQRSYEHLEAFTCTSTISEAEQASVLASLTLTNSKPFGYLGQAYKFDDGKLAEDWLCAFEKKASSSSSRSSSSKGGGGGGGGKRRRNLGECADDEVIKPMVSTTLEKLLGDVEDKVLTETGVLERGPLDSSVCREAPCWGIDCHCRRMIELVLQERVPQTDKSGIRRFIERKLLPTINSMPSELAHNMYAAANAVAQAEARSSSTPSSSASSSSFSSSSSSSSMDALMATALAAAVTDFGFDSFRIHPKGTGVICTSPQGIPPNTMVCEYLGELYPPYRWCERLDVIEQAQQKYGLKPTLPDFYNILLERPFQDPAGYSLLYVDASTKANMGSTVAHSCDSNCLTAVVARQGRLSIVLTTTRHVHYGEELTHDYSAYTTSDVEWRAAVCLCGTAKCRGSFLHYATQEDLQQILDQNFGPLSRYAALLRSSCSFSLDASEAKRLETHGFYSACLGTSPPAWLSKFTANNLRFIEFERGALPTALLRDETYTTFSSADADARCVMEQRIQSLVCTLSMIRKVLEKQPESIKHAPPLKALSVEEILEHVWGNVRVIPDLLSTHYAAGTGDGGEKCKAEEDVESQKRLQMALVSMRGIVSVKPKGLLAMQEAILSMVEVVKSIVDLETPLCRLRLLADMLVLWAHTKNFSLAQRYLAVQSDPITVPARELGTDILREALLGHEGTLSSPSTSSSSLVSGVAIEDASSTVAAADVTSVYSSATDAETLDVSTESIETSFVSDGEAMDTACSFKSDSPLSSSSGGSGETEAKKILSIKTTLTKESKLLSPHELVHTGLKRYEESFIFWQLMDWVNAGTDKKASTPDLFGCVQLPTPSQCFGVSETIYGAKQRGALLGFLQGEDREKTRVWPPILKKCFSASMEDRSSEELILGSPTLDEFLGKGDIHTLVLEGLGETKVKKSTEAHQEMQLDERLAPEDNCSWVQCDDCLKWRRVPFHVVLDASSDAWNCSLNTWDADSATCSAPQDDWNPDKEEIAEISGGAGIDDVDVGAWRDVYCTKNCIYYEAEALKVKKNKKAGDKKKLLWHFKGWSSKFDEWIEVGSSRIKPHNFFTNALATTVQENEAWQGFKGVSYATKGASKKRSLKGNSTVMDEPEAIGASGEQQTTTDNEAAVKKQKGDV